MAQQAALPTFSKIKADQVVERLETLLNKNRHQLSEILQTQTPTWENVMLPLEDMGDELHEFWSPIRHLHAVVNSAQWREVYKACLPKISEYSMELMQNRALFEKIEQLANSPAFQNLNKAQKKVLEHMLRDFRLAGVHLESTAQQRFAELNKTLTQLCAQFEENTLDATQGWTRHITDAAALSGIPAHAVAAARQAAEQKQLVGWLFTLEMPSYLAIMEHADDRGLREEMYRAFVTRASDQGPQAGKWDNSPVMEQILQARLEMAHLLGFENYAENSLATKMAKTPEEVLNFLEQLATASVDQAKKDFAELKRFAYEHHKIQDLQAWDVPYYSEKLRQQAYAVAKEDFRPYFPEDKVLQGLFAIVHRLYGLNITELKNQDIWEKSVRVFALQDEQGHSRGHLYVDLYARQGKRDGAWMDDCRSRRKLRDGEIQTPIAFITCNFNAPVGDAPALFTHDDVNTLFHEFGHALQHLLTTVDYADVSGINGIPWDAVEIASQFMESWCWEKPGVDLIAEHYQTQQLLPETLFNKLMKAKNFQSAMQMMRQLQFALFDFRLHTEYDPQQTHQIQHILDEVRHRYGVFPTPAFNRFQHTFGHIFAGGYAAGYYSYKWAEVLACDAFSKFEENGIFDRATGESFLQTFLAQGGVEEPMDLFIRFRGRPPKIDALLKYNGIAVS
ncbi:MAG: M3 family metallopeptidase [Gammaproteobacteria bacterium]